MRFFMGGDVFAESGLVAVQKLLPDFVRENSVDVVIINGENSAGGYGIQTQEIQHLLSCGVTVITGGNHIFEKRDVYPVLDSEQQILRPANFPDGTPGRGMGIYQKNGVPFCVINLQGRESMTAVDCPFHCADQLLETLHKNNADCKIVLIDFHAESNAEKEALALSLNGKVSAVCGTHTHVQTADSRILSRKTAYITDLGLTGPIESVIGSDPQEAILRNKTGIARRMIPATGAAALEGVLIDIDPSNGAATAIKTVHIRTE